MRTSIARRIVASPSRHVPFRESIERDASRRALSAQHRVPRRQRPHRARAARHARLALREGGPADASGAAARAFAERWRPAWTGNDPERLAGFYSDDALYLDPEVPLGVRGRPAPIAYFRRLLALNPAWVWTQIEGIPLEDGFLNSWRAEVPIGAESMTIVGVCFVQLDASGKIRRNEVYFDRSDWLAAIARQRHARAAGRPSRLHATCARRG
jgi:hypothetical protein